jgi:K+-sensing histidine kinase KdpD
MPRTAKKSDLMRATIAALVCGCLAAFLCLLQGDETSRLVILLLFLLCVIPLGVYFGRVTAIIGSTVASLTFALLLFPPLYSFRIQNNADRLNLTLFQAVAITLACLSGKMDSSETLIEADHWRVIDTRLDELQRIVEQKRGELGDDGHR